MIIINVTKSAGSVTIDATGVSLAGSAPSIVFSAGSSVVLSNDFSTSSATFAAGSTLDLNDYDLTTYSSSRASGSTISGPGRYLLPFAVAETDDDGTLADGAYLQDYNIPAVSGVGYLRDDDLMIVWSAIAGVSSFFIDVVGASSEWTVDDDATCETFGSSGLTAVNANQETFNNITSAAKARVCVECRGVPSWSSALEISATISSFSAVAISHEEIRLSWSDVGGANVILSRSTDQTTWTTLATISDTTTYDDEPPESGIVYYYRATIGDVYKIDSAYLTTADQFCALVITVNATQAEQEWTAITETALEWNALETIIYTQD